MLRRTATAAAGGLPVLMFGFPLGLLIGPAAAAAVWYSFTRLADAERVRRRARLVADLPVAVDLLAACLRGGTPWQDAVTRSRTRRGPLGEELERVSVQIRLGADPAAAWLALTEEPTLAPLARAAVRATSAAARSPRPSPGWPGTSGGWPAPPRRHGHGPRASVSSPRSACASCPRSSCSASYPPSRASPRRSSSTLRELSTTQSSCNGLDFHPGT
ncbi:type II secretion system F family protein [Actinomadura sp. CNU-125]|uniref:type II secretion system F family protein n=1 Tax=Actinomadura sp. CNU-125 TaxID=1904961 RepID=UPI0021CC88E7|nr:type II secretion system F family protein [Actinomadura sp. CNU-125]